MCPEPDAPSSAAPVAGRSALLNASTHIERGWNLISRGEHAAAEEELQKALALVPDDTQAASLLGWAQMLQEKYDDALVQFYAVLQRDPQHAIARVNVGYICLKKSIYGEAIEHLTRVHQGIHRSEGDAVRALLPRPAVFVARDVRRRGVIPRSRARARSRT